MPFAMNWEAQGVHTRFSGSVTAADLLRHVEEVCRNPAFDDLRFSILDFRDATYVVNDLELADIRAQLLGAQYTNPYVLVAAVATDEDAVDHLQRLARLGALTQPMQVFASPEDAVDWIAVQSHSLQPFRPRH